MSLLRNPFSTANREALGFVVLFYGIVFGLPVLLGLGLWFWLG